MFRTSCQNKENMENEKTFLNDQQLEIDAYKVDDFFEAEDEKIFINRDTEESFESYEIKIEDIKEEIVEVVENLITETDCELILYNDVKIEAEDPLGFEAKHHTENFKTEVAEEFKNRDFEAAAQPKSITKNSRLTHKENRKLSQLKRNSGQEYISRSGKLVAKRTIKSLSPCKKQCHLKITLKDQESIFSSYWKEGSYASRFTFLSSCIEMGPKKRSTKAKTTRLRKYSAKYFLYTDNGRQEVCKKCIRFTLGETDSFFRSVSVRMWGLIDIKDERGRHVPSNKTQPNKVKEIQAQIIKFPAYEGQYSKSRGFNKYLGSELTIPIMYEMYKKEVSEPSSVKIYRKIFRMTGLKFKAPNLYTCSKCDSFAARLKLLIEVDERKRIFELQKIHHRECEDAFKMKSKDKNIADLGCSMPTIVCSFDLQQSLPTPFNQDPIMFYKRPLWTYNLTISSSTLNNTDCYMWHENIANRSVNEVASCLYNYLKNLSPRVKRVIFYSTNSCGQLNNEIVSAMFLSFMAKHPTLKILDHKIFATGHTNMKCNVVHAVIERAKKKLDQKIEVPDDWYELVRNVRPNKPFNVRVMSRENFFNFEKLFKEPLALSRESKESFFTSDVKWLRYTKTQGQVYYKTSLNEDDEFQILDLRERGILEFDLDKLKLCYEGDLPIGKEKKDDLLSILDLLSPSSRLFYENLLSEENSSLSNFDPDIDRIVEVDLEQEN